MITAQENQDNFTRELTELLTKYKATITPDCISDYNNGYVEGNDVYIKSVYENGELISEGVEFTLPTELEGK